MILSLLLLVSLFIGLVFLLRRNFLNLLMGIILLGNAANLTVFYTSSPKMNAYPFIRNLFGTPENLADPLPQALILTAIVISFALFCLVAAIFKKALGEYNIKGDDDLLDEGHDEVFK